MPKIYWFFLGNLHDDNKSLITLAKIVRNSTVKLVIVYYHVFRFFGKSILSRFCCSSTHNSVFLTEKTFVLNRYLFQPTTISINGLLYLNLSSI